HLQAAIGAVEQLSELLLPYPYAELTVIDPPPEAQAGAGGVEYPTLVTTQSDTPITPLGLRLPEYVTIHEVGHQWFQGMIATDEVAEPWLDEGVNEYIDAVVLARLYPDAAHTAESLALRRAALAWAWPPRVPIAT